ncbi:MAG: response regulator transcription factor [Alphaproteobacteria bacterium]|nr:response regulator transcription factor [Alphaproteobacteria bacterium]
MNILLIEDDEESANYIAKGLRESGHIVDYVTDGEKGLEMALAGQFDVLVVDRMLPLRDGLSVVSALRAQDVQVPVLFLSALGEVGDRVDGLKAGGDDYLPKPFAFTELLARVEALAKRTANGASVTNLTLADLTIDLLSRRVTRQGKDIILQPREFKLLEYLLRHAGQVVTRTMLLEQVWEYHFDPQTNIIDVHISRLRSKLDKEFDPPLLHTIRGAGYSLRVPV